MTDLQLTAKEAINHVYSLFSIEPTTSRKRHNVQIRASIGVCLFKYLSQRETQEVMKQHRTTILYHVKNHEMNLLQWVGYLEKFNLIKPVIDSYLQTNINIREAEILNNQIGVFKDRVKTLEERRKVLVEDLASEEAI